MKITFIIPDDTTAVHLSTWAENPENEWDFTTDEYDVLEDGAVYDITDGDQADPLEAQDVSYSRWNGFGKFERL